MVKCARCDVRLTRKDGKDIRRVLVRVSDLEWKTASKNNLVFPTICPTCAEDLLARVEEWSKDALADMD